MSSREDRQATPRRIDRAERCDPALGPGALADLTRVLGGSGEYRHAVLIAMADTDEVVRLRLLRAIRGVT